MDQTHSPFVLTKLRVPAARPRAIPRPRLMERLAPENRAGLTLVCAPAGYGKTTLLTAWARALSDSGTAVAWFALDAGDDDPAAFGAYLIASLVQALGPLPELAQVAQLLRSAPEIDLLRVLPLVINAIIVDGRECALILDDYHLVTSPSIHSAMAYLLDHLPENLRIAIGSRSEPPLPLARLRARGQLIEVRAAGLRFKGAETAQFLSQVMGLDLPPEMVSTLEARTEGWAAGLQLAALALSADKNKESQEGFITAFTGSHRYLVEYLMEEVVNRQPEEAQFFLLLTSVLDRLCAPLCEAVMRAGGMVNEETDSTSSSPHQPIHQLFTLPPPSILADLERANLFVIALDDAAGDAGGAGTTGVHWFRYHHLFRDFLLAQLVKTQPERIPVLHRAACAWLAAQGYLREAALHAFQTRDWEYAAAFVEQNSFTLVLHSEIALLYEWCSAFPEEIMLAHPLLCAHQCWALVFSFRRQNRGRVETRLGQVEQRIAGAPDTPQMGELKEMINIIRTFLSMMPDPAADPRAQLAISQAMLQGYPDGHPGQFSGLLTLGYAYLALHDAEAAAETLQTARQAALVGHLYFGIVESTFHLARLAHAQGRFDHAAELCRQGHVDIAALLPHPEQGLPALGCLDIALGCALLDQGRMDEAERNLLRGMEQVGWGSNPFYLMTACVGLFRLYEAQGRSAEALKYLDHLQAAWPDIAFCTNGLRITHALKITPGDSAALADASAWCESYTPITRIDGLPPGMGPFGSAEVYYLASLAWTSAMIQTGRPEAALPYLQRQLKLAEVHNLAWRTAELSLLRDQAILGKEQHPSANLNNVSGVEPLSERELEVLRLVASGASNQQIADRLVISVGTVKSHLNHILGKLNAANRTEAAALARERRLID